MTTPFFTPSAEQITRIDSLLLGSIHGGGLGDWKEVRTGWGGYVVVYLGYTKENRRKVLVYALDWRDIGRDRSPTLSRVLDIGVDDGGCMLVVASYDVDSSTIEAANCNGEA